MRLRALWAQAAGWYAAHSTRDRRIVAGVGALAALSVLYVGVVQPLAHYRQRAKTEPEVVPIFVPGAAEVLIE